MKILKQKLIIATAMLFMGLFSSCIDLFDEDPCSECQSAVNHYAAAVDKYGCDNSETFKDAYQKMYNACARKALDYQWMICSGEIPKVCK